mgnify:CR=1 FL=1
MNNNMPNNNGNNTEGLNAVSLGSVNSSNGGSVPPVPPIENLDTEMVNEPSVSAPNNGIPSNGTFTSPLESVAPVEPVSPVSDSLNNGASVSPVNYDIPQTINNFDTTPVFNDIGTVPPISDGPIPDPNVNFESSKPKKKQNKLIFVIIIVLLIAAVGVGVYIFLNVSNQPSVSVILKEVNIELGGEVSTNIDDYATFTGINSANCSLDTSNITDTSVLNAEYSFSITCNNSTYTGTAKVVDTVAPEVTMKEVTVQAGAEVRPGDFIDVCTEATECSYAFRDEEQVIGYVAEAGTYEDVEIVVTDSSGNETTVMGTLIVTDEAVPTNYMVCSLNNEAIRIGLISGSLSGNVVRTYTFTFENEDSYNSFKSSNLNSTEVTYENVTGTPSFDDATLTLTLTQELTKEQLDQESGTTIPTSYGELRSYFGPLGYTCTLE